MNIKGIYDNGGSTIDRYTVVTDYSSGADFYLDALSLSDNPTDAQGFSQWGLVELGRHLGKKISFEQLPVNVQQHVKERLA